MNKGDQTTGNSQEQTNHCDQGGKPGGVYTAAQIARALGITRQGADKGLSGVAPSGVLQSAGKSVSAWSFGALPLDWQLEITRRGVKRGFENGEDYLANMPKPWKAPLPWDQVPSRYQIKAVKLQAALAPVLELRRDPDATAAQAEAAGLAAFKAQFGYPISDRQLRWLLKRTIDNDGGEGNWQRPDIYLDARAFVKPKAATEVLRKEYLHRDLDEVLTALENRQAPTVADKMFLWDAAFRHYEQITAELPDSGAGNKDRRLAKLSLVHYLFKAFPERTLCATESSLRRRFEEKLDLWRANGRKPEALEDQRPVKSGKFRQVQFPEDLKAIRDRAILHDGNIALAYRLLREESKLSPEFCDFYHFDPRTAKSEVPHAVRRAVENEVDMCLPLRRGPWQARMRGPYIQRDWSGVKPGDWFCADDVTWNHYFREQLPDGRWRLLRGECLLMTDLRTGYPLDFLLIAGKYNGEHVRNLALRVHDRIGLPHQGFYFERGVWRSRLVVGDTNQGTPVHWRETQNGLCSADLQIDVRSATTPRAKPIEGLLRLLQERMRSIPGFVGFNERTQEMEREQEMIALANRGDAAAIAKFPTQTQWAEQISGVLEAFSRDPQNGEMVKGQSPAEAWAVEMYRRPLRRLPNEARYILSTHRKEVPVRQEGIVLTIRGQRRVYFNEHTGRLIGQRVLAFYNLEMPELLTVSDMNRNNYFSVQAVKLPAMTATREQLQEVRELRKAHMAPAKAIFGQIQHPYRSFVSRDNEQSAASKELGRFHNAEMERAKVEKSATDRKARRARQKVAEVGFDPAALRIRNPEQADRIAEDADKLSELIARAKREEQEQELNHD
jgi:hypothetical protein